VGPAEMDPEVHRGLRDRTEEKADKPVDLEVVIVLGDPTTVEILDERVLGDVDADPRRKLVGEETGNGTDWAAPHRVTAWDAGRTLSETHMNLAHPAISSLAGAFPRGPAHIALSGNTTSCQPRSLTPQNDRGELSKGLRHSPSCC